MKLVREELSGSEAIYGFAGWLTTQDKKTIMGSHYDCALIADKIEKFIEANDLEDPEDHWEDELNHPSEEINESKSQDIINLNREHFKEMILKAMKEFRLSRTVAADMLAHGILSIANEMYKDSRINPTSHKYYVQ